MNRKSQEIDELLDKLVCAMTGKELLTLIKAPAQEKEGSREKRYVYGIFGIAELFGCSIPTASRIKRSGIIDDAITQVGRKIVVDADKALMLVALSRKRMISPSTPKPQDHGKEK